MWRRSPRFLLGSSAVFSVQARILLSTRSGRYSCDLRQGDSASPRRGSLLGLPGRGSCLASRSSTQTQPGFLPPPCQRHSYPFTAAERRLTHGPAQHSMTPMMMHLRAARLRPAHPARTTPLPTSRAAGELAQARSPKARRQRPKRMAHHPSARHPTRRNLRPLRIQL